MPEKSIVYWGDQLSKTAPDTSTVTIKTEQVERGHCFHVFAASIVDETTVNKLLEIGIKRGSEYFPIDKRKAGTNDYSLSPGVRNQILKEGEQLYGKVYSPTTGDKCVLVFCGEISLRE